MRLAREDAEMRSRHVGDILEDGAVRGAKLAREIKAEARAFRLGGKERLEELALRRWRDAGTVVDDAQLHPVGEAAKRDAHAFRLGTGIAHGVPEQVPEHLPQVLAVKLDRGVAARLDDEALARHALVGDELIHERRQPAIKADELGGGAIAAV